jgi:hypothetical protein
MQGDPAIATFTVARPTIALTTHGLRRPNQSARRPHVRPATRATSENTPATMATWASDAPSAVAYSAWKGIVAPLPTKPQKMTAESVR